MARKKEFGKKELLGKIVEKKEFSKLPKNDVLRVFSEFDSDDFSQEEKIKKTREKLMKIYTAFASTKIMNNKNKNSEWFLKKHISTKERFEFYDKIYSKTLEPFSGMKKITIFDLGSGINGLSYNSFKREVNYIAIEAVGQFVDLMNYYFKTKNLKGRAIHESLFELEKIKILLKKELGKKIVFLFKALDSLEMVERNFSKTFLKEIVPLVDLVVVSWATKTLRKGSKIFATKKWLLEFIENNFEVKEILDIGSEKYVIFSKR